MILRDSTGVPIEKGNRVVFPLGLGQSAIGQIVETHSGLGLDGTAARQPVVILNVTVVLPADQNGIVGGLCRLPDPVAPPAIAEE
jgi:hypothetical protein